MQLPVLTARGGLSHFFLTPNKCGYCTDLKDCSSKASITTIPPSLLAHWRLCNLIAYPLPSELTLKSRSVAFLDILTARYSPPPRKIQSFWISEFVVGPAWNVLTFTTTGSLHLSTTNTTSFSVLLDVSRSQFSPLQSPLAMQLVTGSATARIRVWHCSTAREIREKGRRV